MEQRYIHDLVYGQVQLAVAIANRRLKQYLQTAIAESMTFYPSIWMHITSIREKILSNTLE